MRALLVKRGVTDPEDIATFLTPDYRRLHNPFTLHDMERAVARMFSALERGEHIALYADFDCDGIPGAALLYDFFQKIGYTNVETYIPHRDREGYGLHVSAIEELATRASLIITVDVGTTAAQAVARAKELGVDVIVTDHHELTGPVPECAAVVNPKLGEYPFRDLCGAAVAWKFVCAALAEGRTRGLPNFIAVPNGWEKWLLDLVALATVSDLVPLIGENRVLVYFGLTVLRKTLRPGLRALAAHTRLRLDEVTEEDIGFSFAPRINAASRMGEPESAWRLLTTKDVAEAGRLALHLEELNAARKTTVATIVREAKKRIRSRFTNERVVVLGDTAWKPALLGLAANSIMEERGGMVCLWGRDAEGRLKGSCRSDGTLSVVEVFSRAKVSLEEYGGHSASGGFSVSYEAVHTLHEVMAQIAEEFPTSERASAQEPDIAVSLSELTPALFGELSLLAPFGVGNPKPLIAVSDVSIAFVRPFGKEKNHLEVGLTCPKTGASCRGFDFFRAPDSFSAPPMPGAHVQILGTLEKDGFRGGLALRLVDIVAGR